MTEVRQGPTPRVRFREVSVKRELAVFSFITAFYLIYIVVFLPQDYYFFLSVKLLVGKILQMTWKPVDILTYYVCAR